MTILFCIIASLLLLAALIGAFKPGWWAPLCAWCALLFLGIAIDKSIVGWQVVIFWGVAAALAMGIDYLSTRRPSRSENAYTVGGALVGAIVGMIISSAAIIVGAAIGAFFGAMAWSRTPAGHNAAFPSRPFFNTLLRIGLPAVVTMSIVGIVVYTMLVL